MKTTINSDAQILSGTMVFSNRTPPTSGAHPTQDYLSWINFFCEYHKYEKGCDNEYASFIVDNDDARLFFSRAPVFESPPKKSVRYPRYSYA